MLFTEKVLSICLLCFLAYLNETAFLILSAFSERNERKIYRSVQALVEARRRCRV